MLNILTWLNWRYFTNPRSYMGNPVLTALKWSYHSFSFSLYQDYIEINLHLAYLLKNVNTCSLNLFSTLTVSGSTWHTVHNERMIIYYYIFCTKNIDIQSLISKRKTRCIIYCWKQAAMKPLILSSKTFPNKSLGGGFAQ